MAGGSMKPVSDGVAFNRLLCLSQLCYIIASNVWTNTPHGKMWYGAEKRVWSEEGGVNS